MGSYGDLDEFEWYRSHVRDRTAVLMQRARIRRRYRAHGVAMLTSNDAGRTELTSGYVLGTRNHIRSRIGNAVRHTARIGHRNR